ncbi:MAG: enolase-phosphatase E1 [Myxococcota bacterium]|jgi:enolase-phosphatase E1
MAQEPPMPIPMSDSPYNAVVLDIEGTTTSISFVYDALFPFARRGLRAFLATHWEDPAVRQDVATMSADLEGPDAAADHALKLMDDDVKDTGLKGLQGRIWRAGYLSGELRGHVFPDVPPALERWRGAQVPVYIYSSGSIAAQKLLFGHSLVGDLLGLLKGHFDTTTGPKKKAASYRAIAEAIAVTPSQTLFATDSLAEAEAAREAGFQVAVCVRPDNPALAEHGFRTVSDFTSL